MPGDGEDLKLGDETGIPIKWVIGLLVGCATFTVSAFSAGSYLGSRDANAGALERRVTTLEEAIKKIPDMAEGIARLEGAMGTLPKERMPAASGGH